MNTIDHIKSKIDIVELIGSFIELKRSGRNYIARCPFHQETSPSFVVSPDRQIWHCFGACHEGGDIFSFIMKWENISFPEALRELAHKAGVELKEDEMKDESWTKKERLLQMNTLAAQFYQYVLHNTTYGKEAKEYLTTRGINEKIMYTFELGYASNSWDSLLRFLRKKGFSDAEGIQVGLLVRTDKGRVYDRFRHRLVFPIHDPRGNIIGFSGRILSTEAKTAKYINTPETPIYHKRESLYGIHLTKDTIRQEQNALLVEGEFDMITPYQHGIQNVVAIKGSAVTHEQLVVLKRYTQKITLALDADTAGQDAVKRGIEEAEKMDIEVQVVSFPEGKDPDEAVRTNFPLFKKSIKHGVSIYDFLIFLARDKYPGNDPYNKKKLSEEVIPHIATINNPIVQSHYVRYLAEMLEVTEESIIKAIRAHHRKKKVYTPRVSDSDRTQQEHKMKREEMIQRYLVGKILQAEDAFNLLNRIQEHLPIAEFQVPVLRKILYALQEYQEHNDTFHLNDFLNHLPRELQALANEVYLFVSSNVPLEQENIEKLALEARRFLLKKKMADFLNNPEENEERSQELANIAAELKALEKKVHAM